MTDRSEALIPDHWAEDRPRRRLCAHADDGPDLMHWLEPGQRCPWQLFTCVMCGEQSAESAESVCAGCR